MTRQGLEVRVAHTQAQAATALDTQEFEVIVLDLILEEGSALAIADLASYRYPDTKLIFVTDTAMFSDGSIFAHCANACAFLQSDVPPEDLTAVVEYHGARR
jgi:DNA-binding NtrC family response regulator